MESQIFVLEALLLVAGVVAMLAQRFKLPYTVGLVSAGIALAFARVPLDITLSKDLIFTAFLPPLIFEAALHLRWSEVRRDAPVVGLLASGGVVLSAVITAAGMHWLARWPWPAASLFGALIAATDPVSVIATFKEAGVTGRLRLLVEAESLLNDGVAAVAFVIALSISSGASLSAGGIATSLLWIVGGGVVCGALVAGAMLIIAGRTEDHLIEITFTTVAAYGSFLLAEHFHCSGVLATLTAGLMIGNLGPLGSISAKGRDAVISFWDYAAFVVNSLIFILIGLHEAKQDFRTVLLPIVAAIGLVTLGRAIAVYSSCVLFAASRLRVSRAHQHVLFWGGLRGALALALALGLPPDFPGRAEIVAVTFAVVAFSIIVQGLTMTPLLRKLKEIGLAKSAAKL